MKSMNKIFCFYLIKQTSIVEFGVKVNIIGAVSPGSIFRKAFTNRNGPSIFNRVLCNYNKSIDTNFNIINLTYLNGFITDILHKNST